MLITITVEPDTDPRAAVALARVLANLLVVFGFRGVNEAATASMTNMDALVEIAKANLTTQIVIRVRADADPKGTD